MASPSTSTPRETTDGQAAPRSAETAFSVPASEPNTLTAPDNPQGFSPLSLAFHVARYEVRSRYARSLLGSFWITLQQALFIGAAALVFPAVFNTSVASYVPFFAVSLLLWNFMSSCILESLDALGANGPLIKDRGVSPEIFLWAVVFRNLLMSAHALPIAVIVIIAFQSSSITGLLLALPGFALFFVVAAAVSYAVGIVAARYRDLKRLTESVIQLAFLATPILWKPGFVSEQNALVVLLNPLAHLFNSWREPLLEGRISLLSLGLSALTALISIAVAWMLHRQRRKVAIWI